MENKKLSNPDQWKPGKYKAKAVDWGISKTKENLPQVMILFEYNQPGEMPGTTESRQRIWYGSFKGGALERTMDVLEMLGLKQAPYPAMESGREGKALDPEIEVEVVIEHRANQSGEIQAGISWVNRLGGRGLTSKLSGGEAQQVFAQANAQYMGYLQSKGVKPVVHPLDQPKTTFNEEDVPF